MLEATFGVLMFLEGQVGRVLASFDVGGDELAQRLVVAIDHLRDFLLAAANARERLRAAEDGNPDREDEENHDYDHPVFAQLHFEIKTWEIAAITTAERINVTSP